MEIAFSTRELLKSLKVLLCVVFNEPPAVPDLFFKNLNFCAQKRTAQFGGITAVVRPVPIPNTAVKHCMADGSGCIASARVGSRQSFKLKPGESSPGFFIVHACRGWRKTGVK